jgi:hypothetical protein
MFWKRKVTVGKLGPIHEMKETSNEFKNMYNLLIDAESYASDGQHDVADEIFKVLSNYIFKYTSK